MIKQNKPIVGFCLGAQLIAEALGARTQRSPEKEVGIYPVRLTDDGRQDPILKSFPAAFQVLHSHHDIRASPRRGFIGPQYRLSASGVPLSDRVYGFQFHMEPTRGSIKPLLENAVKLEFRHRSLKLQKTSWRSTLKQ